MPLPRMFRSRPSAWHFPATLRTDQPVKSGIVRRGPLLISMMPASAGADGHFGRSGTCWLRGAKDLYETGRAGGNREPAAAAFSESGDGDSTALPRTWGG